ncbi:energy-coupling factor ABC transporter permease [Actinotalea sp. M2MS4P-6]|uniref:energy-coupling factor ABC transporter permease n=1 Tax=Actinotalea sp. M2MS4P-6 TaxID=2983762 RepID=UPI0021E35A9A|nr:energy-coupling factor ABC transporter permease [Actinotalea sp. M2MS4P-6]MCV2392983.1 energy-coupling factor ABC transporter permease [Actinotalea sp. M2MS4P-6]
MHVPDGFLDVPTSIATGAIAVGAVGVALRRAEREIAETGPALPGLTAAFVFAAQMVNFPVGAGTSGHLLGGALAAVLVGPWTGMLVLTAVLLVQGLLFADGGLTALGTNVVNMAVVGVLVGYLVARLVLRWLPRRARSVVPAGAIGAFVSVPAAAMSFTVLYAIGGAVDIPLPRLAGAMLGWHLVIGVGEAAITAAVLSAVVATRPDLIYLARHLPAEARAGEPAVAPGPTVKVRTGARPLAIGSVVTLVVAGGLSLFASADPDGLEYVGEAMGFGTAARDSAAATSPLADYALSGVADPWLSGSAAGVIGVLVTVALGLAAAALVVRLRGRRVRPEPSGVG